MAAENNGDNITNAAGLQSETAEPVTEFAEKNMVSGMAWVPPSKHYSASASEDVTAADNEPNQDFLHEPIDRSDPNMRTQSESGSVMHFEPHYNPLYGNLEHFNGGGISKQVYQSSAGYHERCISNGKEIVNFYPWDIIRNGYKSGQSPADLSKYFPSINGNGTGAGRKYASRSYVRSNQEPSSFGRSKIYAPNLRQINEDFHPTRRSSLPADLRRQYVELESYPQINIRAKNGSHGFGFSENYKGNKDADASKELVCGPRVLCGGSSFRGSETADDLPISARRTNYNLPDFQTEYDHAKFYVIKSFGEDNVHKSLKYGVWSSTATGNEKLDKAFHEARAKSTETGKRCPIFLLFSVNRSGQFLGLAEMTGRVDFNKDLDFWQLDKWTGWFSVKWHIVKDVPHSELRHIILRENDNRPVTYTRDTQEVGLHQGMVILKIFKNYNAKSSLLDDFPFYENREKLLVAGRNNKSGTQPSEEYSIGRHEDEDGSGYVRMRGNDARTNRTLDLTSSIISKTRNLSLNSRSPP